MKTLIAIPCMDEVCAPFAQSLATLRKDGECIVAMQIGSLIYESRNKLAQRALELECDYVMWFDSDMIIPADALTKMVKHMEEGKDMVTGVYYRRQPPFTPVLFKTLGVNDQVGSWEGYNDYPENEMFELDGAGFGCVMIKSSVLLDMIANKGNWFEPLAGFGEDLSFFIRAKELGYKLYCDPSIQCGHIGRLTITKQVYDSTKGKNA